MLKSYAPKKIYVIQSCLKISRIQKRKFQLADTERVGGDGFLCQWLERFGQFFSADAEFVIAINSFQPSHLFEVLQR